MIRLYENHDNDKIEIEIAAKFLEGLQQTSEEECKEWVVASNWPGQWSYRALWWDKYN